MNSHIMWYIYEKGSYKMFDEMRNAINAAEDVINQLKWKKESLSSSLDLYNNRIKEGDELAEWEVSDKNYIPLNLT